MNDSMQQAVLDTLEFLSALQRESVRPNEARARLQSLRKRHPDLSLDLLLEEQVYDQSVHYDVLIRRAGEATVSMSYCPERAVPWPLRGVHRWSEGDLVRVNTKTLQVDQAMACLDFIWDEAPVIEQLINVCLIQEELDREPINLSDADLQEAMDHFRSAKKLFKAEDTLRWLERHGMTHEKLEQYVADNALVPKLRDRIAGDRVEEYFHQHQADFDTAWVARFEVPDPSKAGEFGEQIRTGRLDFFAVAERLFFESVQRSATPEAGLFAVIQRREAAPNLREQLFQAQPGQMVGPIEVDSRHILMRVIAINPGRLDARTGTAIKNIIFKDWLAERRQEAKIDWCWGNATKTSSA
jgi:putative peptide maturation system protein